MGVLVTEKVPGTLLLGILNNMGLTNIVLAPYFSEKQFKRFVIKPEQEGITYFNENDLVGKTFHFKFDEETGYYDIEHQITLEQIYEQLGIPNTVYPQNLEMNEKGAINYIPKVREDLIDLSIGHILLTKDGVDGLLVSKGIVFSLIYRIPSKDTSPHPDIKATADRDTIANQIIIKPLTDEANVFERLTTGAFRELGMFKNTDTFIRHTRGGIISLDEFGGETFKLKPRWSVYSPGNKSSFRVHVFLNVEEAIRTYIHYKSKASKNGVVNSLGKDIIPYLEDMMWLYLDSHPEYFVL